MSTTLFGMKVRANPLLRPGELLMYSGDGRHVVAAQLVNGKWHVSEAVETSKLLAAATPRGEEGR